MAMLSPPEIINHFDEMIDEIISVYNKEKNYCWETIREKYNPIIDALRTDIDLSEGEIRYIGTR